MVEGGEKILGASWQPIPDTYNTQGHIGMNFFTSVLQIRTLFASKGKQTQGWSLQDHMQKELRFPNTDLSAHERKRLPSSPSGLLYPSLAPCTLSLSTRNPR